MLAFVWAPQFLPRGAIGVLVAWGVLTGICEIVAAVGLPRKLAAHWFVGTGGAFSIFLALLVLGLPHAGSDRVALVLAAYAIVFGIVILFASLRFGGPLRLGARRTRGCRATEHQQLGTRSGGRQSRQEIGVVTDYLDRMGVAVIHLTDGDLHVGDQVHIGRITELTQWVESLQIEHEAVAEASRGSEVAMRMEAPVHRRDEVFRVHAG